jgi:hypothetical protein
MIKRYEDKIRENTDFYSIKLEDRVAFRASVKIHAQTEISKREMAECSEEKMTDYLKEELIKEIYYYLYSDIEKFIHELKVLLFYEMANKDMPYFHFSVFSNKVRDLIDEFIFKENNEQNECNLSDD